MITLSAVLSLVTIVAIYRESGILKRLRATPLRPHTILTAHVVVKLVFAVATLVALFVVGRRIVAAQAETPLVAFSDRRSVQHDEHPDDRLRCRQPGPGRAVRTADRLARVLSDAGRVRPVLSGRVAPANATPDREDGARSPTRCP